MEEIRFCKKHGETVFSRDNKGKWHCKKCRSEAVQKTRNKLKMLSIEYKGGKCEICGYDKYFGALEFHHLNPKEKDFGISEKGSTRDFDKIKKELDKCILVCANCHRELHAKQKENNENSNAKISNKKETKEKQKIDKKKILEIFKEYRNFVQTGNFFGVSDNAIRKWCKKFDLPYKTKELIQYINNNEI